MPIVQPLKVLDIDGQKNLVEDMSVTVQQLVAVYNEWNQDLADARTKHAQLQAAVQAAHTQLSDQIKKEFEEQAQAEADQASAAAAETPALDPKAEAERVVAAERAAQQKADEEAARVADVATEDNFGLSGQTTDS